MCVCIYNIINYLLILHSNNLKNNIFRDINELIYAACYYQGDVRLFIINILFSISCHYICVLNL